VSEREEFLEALRRSREQLGELEPVLLTPEGRIIDGRHRLEAYPGWRKEVADVTPKQAVIERIHRTLKSRVTRKERKAQILELALYLEDEGVGSDDMVGELAKLVPFSEKYIRKLLPKKYKREYLAPTKPKITPEAPIATKVSKPEAEPKPIARLKPKPLECPRCHVELSTILCPKCWTEIELKGWKETT
jgi:hypothetical protein